MTDQDSVPCPPQPRGSLESRSRPGRPPSPIPAVITLALLTICLISPVSVTARQQADMQETIGSSYEVFPLRIGLRRTYYYVRINEDYDINYSSMDNDSGMISYEIVDSSQVDDTTIAWEVREHVDLLGYIGTHAWGWGGFLFDSSYHVDTTTSFILTERTTGDHELNSVSRIWRFPLRYGYGNQVVPVYRYFNTSRVFISRYYEGCLELTASFSEDSGFTSGFSYPLCGMGFISGGAYASTTSFLVGETVTAVAGDSQLPANYSLEQNYPNPFNPSTVIEFSLPVREFTSVKIFNLLGEEVASLVGEVLPAGVHRIRWDAAGVPTGVYLYRMRAGPFQETKKLTVLK